MYELILDKIDTPITTSTIDTKIQENKQINKNEYKIGIGTVL